MTTFFLHSSLTHNSATFSAGTPIGSPKRRLLLAPPPPLLALAPAGGRKRTQPDEAHAVQARAQDEHGGDAAEEHDHAQRRRGRPQAAGGPLGAVVGRVVVAPRRGSPDAAGGGQGRLVGCRRCARLVSPCLACRRRAPSGAGGGRRHTGLQLSSSGAICNRTWLARVLVRGVAETAHLQTWQWAVTVCERELCDLT
jgi:hypothetical protein